MKLVCSDNACKIPSPTFFLDWPSLLHRLDNVPVSSHERDLFIQELSHRLTKQQSEAVAESIVAFCNARINTNRCSMADRSAAFYLTLISTFAHVTEPNVARALIANLSLKTAQHIKRRLPKMSVPVPGDKLDASSLKSLYFAPPGALASPALIATFSKWIAEVKGCPEYVKECFPFLEAFFTTNGTEPAFVAAIDRLSKRNAPLASFLLANIATALRNNFSAHILTIAELLTSDNPEVQENVLAVGTTITVGSVEAIANVFKSPSVKSRENAARFLVKLLNRNKSISCPELVLSLTKELSNESLLSALVEFCAQAHPNELTPFLDATFKPSVKLSSRAAVMLGLLRADALHLIPLPILSATINAALKEAQTAPLPQMLILLIGIFASILARNELSSIAPSVLKELAIGLAKPSGCGLFCDKGWSKMDAELTELWLNKVVVPMLNAQVDELREVAAASLAWFTVHGSIRRFLKGFKAPGPVATDSICDQLARLLATVEFDPKLAWLLLEKLCNSETLRLRKFALVAHNERLLASGIQSWSGLVRKHCQVDEFVVDVFGTLLLPNSFDAPNSAEYRLLESMLVLSPGLLDGKLNLIEMVRCIATEFIERRPLSAQELAYLRGEPAPETKPLTAGKKSEAAAASSVDKDTLNSRTKYAKFVLACCVAAARVLPYSSNFSSIRPEIVCHLTRLALHVPDLVALLPGLLNTLYAVSAECLNGHGPLLVSGMLRCIEIAPNWNWNIPDWESMLGSCVRVSKFSVLEEFSIVALASSKLLPTCKPPLALDLLSHLAKLAEEFDEQTMFVDSSIVESVVPQLIAVCGDDNRMNSQVTVHSILHLVPMLTASLDFADCHALLGKLKPQRKALFRTGKAYTLRAGAPADNYPKVPDCLGHCARGRITA
jgi:hypothetical protein